MATVHHRRVGTGPTPPWYRERRGSHSRMFAMCKARNMRCSLAAWTVVMLLLAVALRLGDSATSYLRPRFAEPQGDYLEVSHPRLKTHCCWQEESTAATLLGKRNGIPALCCWSQPAESRELSPLREALAAEAPRIV